MVCLYQPFKAKNKTSNINQHTGWGAKLTPLKLLYIFKDFLRHYITTKYHKNNVKSKK